MPDLFVATKHLPQDQEQDKEEPAAPKPFATVKPKGKAPHVFSSFCQNPQNIHFQNQEEDEEILLFLRRHFITNLPWIFSVIFLFFLPMISGFIFSSMHLMPAFMSAKMITFLTFFYYLCVFSYALVSFFTWFFNISLITGKRVIDIDFSELVYKNVSATKLDLVQDASFSEIGVIRSVFDYGDVLIQTAGSLDNFDLLAVPHPEKVIQIVENLIGKDNHAI